MLIYHPTVVPPALLPRQLGPLNRLHDRTPVLPKSTRRPRDSNQEKSRSGPRGQSRECAAGEHTSGRRGRE